MSNPRNLKNARHSTAFRLSPDLLDRLDAEAVERVIGRNRLVEYLLTDGLARLGGKRPAMEQVAEWCPVLGTTLPSKTSEHGPAGAALCDGSSHYPVYRLAAPTEREDCLCNHGQATRQSGRSGAPS